MIIVGLSRRARTGKSSLTRKLHTAAESTGWQVVVLPFAGPLKKAAAKRGWTKKNKPDEYRKFCQEHGADMRDMDPAYWVKLWFKDIQYLSAKEEEMMKPLLILVDDVRFQNEVDILVKNNAMLGFVKHCSRKIEDPTGEWRNHISEDLANRLEVNSDEEIKAKGFTYVIYNEGKEKHLAGWAKAFIAKACISDECNCESCLAVIENRTPDSKKIDDELRKLLDDIEGDMNDEET